MRLMKNISSSTISDDSTIVAIATPIGIGAISIVRLSGQNAYNITLSLTHKTKLTPRYAHLCDIYDHTDSILDEAIVLFFPKPHSYTMQDVCEIQCHGGIVSAKAIVQECLRQGARLATAGEFTKRAFLNGRLDLSQTQAVANIIQSQSLQANKFLARQLKGELGQFIEKIRQKLLEILAFSEVNIDYSEELEEDYMHIMEHKLCDIQTELESIYTLSRTRQGLIEGYRLSIVGKPNVGKSSFLNKVLMYDRAIVSPIAGTTRDTIEESIDIAGNIVRIIDTAGIHHSQDEIEQIGVTRSKEAIERSDIVLAIFDASQTLDEQDKAMIEILDSQCQDKWLLVLVNKSDLPIKYDENMLTKLLSSHQKAISKTPLLISAQNGEIKEVLKMLEYVITQNDAGDSLLLTSTYQIQCVQTAITHLQDAKIMLKRQELELFSYHIRDSIESICQITHPYETSELLDQLFSEFCLGK